MATLNPGDARRLIKAAALMTSPVEGERNAAISRVKEIIETHIVEPERPKPNAELKWPQCGTPEWFDALRHWQAKYDFLNSNRTSQLLTKSDLRLVKNVARYRGLPDAPTARRVDELCRRLNYERKD